MCAMSGCTTGVARGCVAAGREECRRWLPVMNLYYRALPSLFSPQSRFGERCRLVRRGTRDTGRLQVEVNEKKQVHPRPRQFRHRKRGAVAELNPSPAFRAPIYRCGRSNPTFCGCGLLEAPPLSIPMTKHTSFV